MARFPARAARVMAVALLLAPAGCQKEAPPGEPDRLSHGRWRRSPDVEEKRERAYAEEVERLRSLSYLSGTRPPPPERGVVLHDPARAQPGLNLYYSGHAPEALLMTMEGEVLHRWRLPFTRAFPDAAPALREREGASHFTRVFLYPNGDLLVIFEGIGIAKIDRHATLLWSAQNGAHHDLEVAPDGRIFLLTRRVASIAWLGEAPVLDDAITLLSPEGEELGRLSLLHAWYRSPFRDAFALPRSAGDVLHTNSIERLDGSLASRDPAFREGALLVSMRNPSWLAVVDFEESRFSWMMVPTIKMPRELRFSQQHAPTVLESGSLLLFDNAGPPRGSRVLELDPFGPALVWEYRGRPPGSFFTETFGAASRLENGNTLITESDTGRAFEVTPDGEKVWAFASPHRAGRESEFVATLFEVVRLSEEDVPWLLPHGPR